MLKRLQGRDNYIYTGMTVIIKKQGKLLRETLLDKIVVTMKELTDKEIMEYISTKDPLDKAGSYAIQGIGSKNIKEVNGNFNAGVGLNIEKLKEMLERNNVI